MNVGSSAPVGHATDRREQTGAVGVPPVRIIARLDIKGPNVIKGVHLEGLRVLGKPGEMARRYYAEGADEIVYMDVVSSPLGHNSFAQKMTSSGTTQ